MPLFRNLFARRQVERDLDDEVAAYVDALVAEKIKAGMPPDEARRAARLEAGAAEEIKDDVRDVRPGALVETTIQDFKYGLRMLRRSPGFAVIAVLTIGLGIGANSAIFSVINGVVRKPLGYPDPDRLMFITSQFPRLNFSKFWVSPPEYFDYKTHTRIFSDVAAYNTGAMNVSEGEQPERVNASFVTANMFTVLGVHPARGTVFTAEQDRPNAEPVVVLSDGLWRRTFGSDPAVVGKRVQINGVARTVLGVMPPGFDLHDYQTQLWLPLGLDPSATNRGSHSLYLVGRLAPAATAAQANAELSAFLKTQWALWAPRTHAPNDSTHRMQMAPLRDEVVGNVRRALWVLQGAVGLVLLIACANVANLLLARAESRHKEFALRTALGAGKGRILRQFIAEGALLSLLGAALGLALAYGGLRALLTSNPGSIPRASEITLDPMVLAFTVGLAVVTGLIFGLAPLLHLGDQAVTNAIKEGGTRSTSNAGRNRVRRGLVAAEIALAVMLVIGAGLLIRTFRNLTSVDAGFHPEGRITFGLVLPRASYPDSQRASNLFSDLALRLEQIPGVQSAASMQGLPPSRQVNANDTDFEDYTFVPGSNGPIENVDYWQFASVGYFETMGIPIKEGRAFQASDAVGAPVIIINEATAKRFFPGRNPLGRRINPYITRDTTWFTIVGIAKDVKQGGVEANAGTELYFNSEQMPRIAGFAPRQMNMVLRSRQPIEALAPLIRRTVTQIDPTLPIVQMRTMDDVIGASLSRQRFLSFLLTVFAVVALTLAMIGTYGVLSYMVSERQREIGIRMALGAGKNQVFRLVLGQGFGMALVGIVVGIVGSMALSRVVATLLFGVKPSDPVTFGAVAAVIAVVAVSACLVPTRRAMRVDPLAAIRAE